MERAPAYSTTLVFYCDLQSMPVKEWGLWQILNGFEHLYERAVALLCWHRIYNTTAGQWNLFWADDNEQCHAFVNLFGSKKDDHF